MRLAPVVLLLAACGGIVEPVPDAAAPPPAASTVAALTTAPALAAWADHLCGARAIAVASVRADHFETREREEYPGAPWIVRTFDGARPASLRRVFRDRSPTACSCRDLAPSEAAYADLLARSELPAPDERVDPRQRGL